MVLATVREWDDDLGWGVLDSAETPEGCWTHCSVIETPLIRRFTGGEVHKYAGLSAGETVELEWEEPGQDGFAYRAVVVRPRVRRSTRHVRVARRALRRVVLSLKLRSSRRHRGVIGILLALCAPLAFLTASCTSGRGYLDDIREEAIVKWDFDFMTETSQKETSGNDGGKPQPDQLRRSFDLGSTSGEEALARVISFAQEDGWSPDPRSARTPPDQLKPVNGGNSLRLYVLYANDRFILTVEGPF